MKRSIIALLFLLAGTLSACAQHVDNSQLKWYTSLAEANQLSKAQHKPIFAFFTGSDWCGWCHKLQRDVFAKPEFIKWASQKVILLELDFPRRKQLPQDLMQQNAGLQQAFRVQGYPTIWYFTMTEDSLKQTLLNALGTQGYPSGAEPGKEEVKFLGEAAAILAKFK